MPALARGFYVPLLLGALGVSCSEEFTSQTGGTSGSATTTFLLTTITTADGTLAPHGDYMEKVHKNEL